MIIIELIGGLGNQMFQYAAGRAVALRNDSRPKLDIGGSKHYEFRNYKLHCVNVVESFANPNEVSRLKKSGRSLWKRISRRVERYLLSPYRRSAFAQRFDHFDPDILQISRSAYLVGYWES